MITIQENAFELVVCQNFVHFVRGGGGDELKLIMQKLDTICWNMIC